jgi:hypothetical protein
MNFKERCVATLFCLVFSSSTIAGLTAEQWKADLAQMNERVREEHLEPFHSLTEAEWERMLERLGKDIPTLSDTQIMARMAIMVAAIGDGTHAHFTAFATCGKKFTRHIALSPASQQD